MHIVNTMVNIMLLILLSNYFIKIILTFLLKELLNNVQMQNLLKILLLMPNIVIYKNYL